MFFIIGFVVVFGSVLGGYLPHGDIAVLIQPFEVLIIVGGAIGAFIISNPKPVLSATAKSFGRVLKGSPYKKEAYVELLTLQYSIFRLAKSKGMLALEAHVEDPHESSLFPQMSLPGTIEVGTGVLDVGRSSVRLSHAIFSDDRCAAQCECVMVMVARPDNRANPVPAKLRTALMAMSCRA